MIEVHSDDNGTLVQADAFEFMDAIPPASVDMVLCDLPYGTTQNKWDSVIDLATFWRHVERVARPNAAVVLTAQVPFSAVLACSNLRDLKYEWVWRKEMGTGHLNAKIAPMKDHENVLVFYREQPEYHPQKTRNTGKNKGSVKQSSQGSNYGTTNQPVWVDDDTRYPRTVVDFPRDRPRLHPTQKPVDLFRYMIRTYTSPDAIVLDPTCGVATTAVAALAEGRRYLCGDLSSEYAEIGRQRILGLSPAIMAVAA